MYNSEQIAFELTYLQDQKSLTLRWRSFPEWGCYRVALAYIWKDCQYIAYG